MPNYIIPARNTSHFMETSKCSISYFQESHSSTSNRPATTLDNPSQSDPHSHKSSTWWEWIWPGGNPFLYGLPHCKGSKDLWVSRSPEPGDRAHHSGNRRTGFLLARCCIPWRNVRDHHNYNMYYLGMRNMYLGMSKYKSAQHRQYHKYHSYAGVCDPINTGKNVSFQISPLTVQQKLLLAQSFSHATLTTRGRIV